MLEKHLLRQGDGARGRSVPSGQNQALGAVQPGSLTDAFPPSPARPLSNLFGEIPRSGIAFAGDAA